jgi:nicotinate phosphoribosyltransferase
VDVYGVGTSLVTGSGAPTAGMVYKLVAVDGRAVEKRSADKQSHGGRKSALRRHKASGTATEEVVFAVGSTAPAIQPTDRVLPVPLMRGGRPAGLPTLEDSRAQLRRSMIGLPWEGLTMSPGEPAIPTSIIGPPASPRGGT